MPSFDPQDPEIPGLSDLTEIGRGGFGTVYRARQAAMSRDVAVKVLSAPTKDSVAAKRWTAELSAMGRLSDHPNIVTVHAADVTPGGFPYLVMAYVSGGSLSMRATAHPLPEAAVVSVGIALASALAAAHDKGVLHLDVKPANVLMSEHGPQLTDFGIARMADSTVTATSSVTATVPFAAPEVLAGRRPGPAADVYGLAATLFAAAAGHGPFEAGPDEHIAAQLNRVLTQPPPDLRAVGIGDELARIIEAGLAKDPEQRIASAAEMRARLMGVGTRRSEGPVTTVLPTTTAIARDPAPAPAPTPAPVPAPVPPIAAPPTPSPAAWPGAAAPTPYPVAQPTPHPAPYPAPYPASPGAYGGPGPGAPPSGRGMRGAVIAVAVVALLLLGAAAAVTLTKGGGDASAATTAPSDGTQSSSGDGSQSSSSDGSPSSSGDGSQSSSDDGSGTPSVDPSPSGTASPGPTDPPATSSAAIQLATEDEVVAAVSDYYATLNAGDFATSWARRTPGNQAASGGYDQYVDFFTNRVSHTEVQGPTTVDLASGEVDTTLVFDLVGGGQSVEQVTITFVEDDSGALLVDDYHVIEATER